VGYSALFALARDSIDSLARYLELIYGSLAVSPPHSQAFEFVIMKRRDCSTAEMRMGMGKWDLPSVILILTSVFSTIFVNSSKLILPSRSLSASIIVLSTIYSNVSQTLKSHTLLPSLPPPSIPSSPSPKPSTPHPTQEKARHTCCNCISFKLLPTIIFNTINNSPLLIYPSRSIS
jgi:hypothetical protein